jgi:hypothetical protein
LISLAIGLYFLLNPEAPAQYGSSYSSGVVSIQKLTLGDTFTIVGAIFLAAAWRPR